MLPTSFIANHHLELVYVAQCFIANPHLELAYVAHMLHCKSSPRAIMLHMLHCKQPSSLCCKSSPSFMLPTSFIANPHLELAYVAHKLHVQMLTTCFIAYDYVKANNVDVYHLEYSLARELCILHTL